MMFMMLICGFGDCRPCARRPLVNARRQGPRSNSALEILRQRYARGEINKKFETKKDLS